MLCAHIMDTIELKLLLQGICLVDSSTLKDFSLLWLPLCGISWPTYGGQKKSTRLLNIVLVFLVANAWLKWRLLGCPNSHSFALSSGFTSVCDIREA